MKSFITLIIFLFSFCTSYSQGFYFGPKGGLTIGFQQWNGLERQALFAYNGAFMIESLDPEYRGSLYIQAGFHQRGSAFRQFNFNGFSNSNKFKFNNLSLEIGAKKRRKGASRKVPYYFFGARLEYNVSTNLDEYEELNECFPFYPFEVFVNKVTYGVSVGGGIEFEGENRFITPYIEFVVSPDLSLQYRSDPTPNVLNCFTSQSTTLPEREIRNLTFEVKAGIRFMREVVYEDY
jgi:hypothetical protein